MSALSLPLSSVQDVAPMRRRSPWRVALHVLAFWNPLISALWPLAFGQRLTLDGWLISMTIASLAFSVSYGGAHVIAYAERRLYRAQGLAAPMRGRTFGFIVAAALMFPGTFAGLYAASWLFDFDPPTLGSVWFSLVIGFSFMAVFSLVYTVRDLRERVTRAENERLRAQVAALTAQMNPHFLFNALNTIAALTHSQPDVAEQTTVRLADLYRGVLEASKSDAHALSAELALCRAYLEIERARFGERLRYEVEMDPALADVPCPPLCVQPLVENAVKHGIAPLAAGGSVAVRVKREPNAVAISVEDSGRGLSAIGGDGSKTALENLRARLQLLYGARAELSLVERSGGGATARMVLPL